MNILLFFPRFGGVMRAGKAEPPRRANKRLVEFDLVI